METQSDTTSAPNGADGGASGAGEASAEAAGGFGDRVKSRARLVKAQLDAAESRARQRWQEVPLKLRGAFQEAVSKVRTGLDLPSRTDVSSLAQRIDELDRKLEEYESQASAKKKKKAEQPGEWA